MCINNFLNKVIKWSKKEELIEGICLVGSYARKQAKLNSDIDLILLCKDTEKYLNDLDWTNNFGNVKKFQKEYYDSVTSIRVWYKDGIEVEYGFTKIIWANIPVDKGTKRVVEDGMKIIYDPKDILLSLQQYVCKN